MFEFECSNFGVVQPGHVGDENLNHRACAGVDKSRKGGGDIAKQLVNAGKNASTALLRESAPRHVQTRGVA